MKNGKCVVIRDEISTSDILNMRNEQQNTSTQNSRGGEETAFSRALNGSKIYLRAQGYIDNSEV